MQHETGPVDTVNPLNTEPFRTEQKVCINMNEAEIKYKIVGARDFHFKPLYADNGTHKHICDCYGSNHKVVY